MKESIENSFAVNETSEQAPRTNRELMMETADQETANKIGAIKRDALASLVFAVDK